MGSILTKEEFEFLVEKALIGLPERIRAKVHNVAFCVEERPNEEQKRHGGVRKDGTLLGLYEGVPQTTWGKRELPLPPDKITIFQESIEKYAKTPDEIRGLVREVVWHEIAHHFGFDEHGARRLDTKRRRK